MKQRRWPDNAKAAAEEIRQLAAEARKKVSEARKHIRRNPDLAEIMLADAEHYSTRIEMLIALAREGIE